MPNAIQIIIDNGYKVRQCTQWHFHVYHDNTFLNIWISKNGNKYMPDRSHKVTRWNDVTEVLSILGTPAERPSATLPQVVEIPKEVTDFHNKLRGKFA